MHTRRGLRGVERLRTLLAERSTPVSTGKACAKRPHHGSRYPAQTGRYRTRIPQLTTFPLSGLESSRAVLQEILTELRDRIRQRAPLERQKGLLFQIGADGETNANDPGKGALRSDQRFPSRRDARLELSQLVVVLHRLQGRVQWLSLIGDRISARKREWLEEPYKNDAALSQWPAQANAFAGSFVPLELRLFDEEVFTFIPTGDLDPVQACHRERDSVIQRPPHGPWVQNHCQKNSPHLFRSKELMRWRGRTHVPVGYIHRIGVHN